MIFSCDFALFTVARSGKKTSICSPERYYTPRSQFKGSHAVRTLARVADRPYNFITIQPPIFSIKISGGVAVVQRTLDAPD
jgi:hypothetical protein